MSPLAEVARVALDRTGRHWSRPCITPGCGRAARLYAGGWRCEDCRPLPVTSEFLGQPAEGCARTYRHAGNTEGTR